MSTTLMTVYLPQDLKAVHTGQDMFDNDTVAHQNAIVRFLLFGQGMIAAGFERLIEAFVGIVVLQAIIAFIQRGSFPFLQLADQVGLPQQRQVWV
nr:hypothetical protein [Chloroflexus sp.]